MNYQVIVSVIGICVTVVIFILQVLSNAQQKQTKTMVDGVSNTVTLMREDYKAYQVQNEQAHKDFRIDHNELAKEVTTVSTIVNQCKTCQGDKDT